MATGACYQSLSAPGVTDPLLRARAAHEAPHVARVRRVAPRMAVVPLRGREPTGPDGLRSLIPHLAA